MYKNFFKRLFDFVIALLLLLILFPVITAVTVVLYFQNNGKPFFFQSRPGKNQLPFNVIKFKTMSDKTDALGNLLSDKERLTSFGKMLRKLSVDELPQLMNVLKGDMSLVGPRPLLFKYIPLYSATQNRRHEVRPGITGWAQVNGRNSIAWTQKFEYDIYYVDHISLALDIKILWMTFLKVILREGVNQSEDRPMLPFDGHN